MSASHRSRRTTLGRPPIRAPRSRWSATAVLEVGQCLGQPQQEQRHRRDRVHASMGLRPVGRLSERGRGEPGSAALSEADLQLARLPDDRRVLGEEAPLQAPRPCRPASSSSAARWNTSEPASGVPARRRAAAAASAADRALHVGGARPTSRPSSSIVPPHGSWCQVPRIRPARRPDAVQAKLGEPAPIEAYSADRSRTARSQAASSSVRISLATPAASSSVHRGSRSSPRSAPEHRRARRRGRQPRRRRRARPHLPWRAMLHADVLAALAAALEPDPSPSPGPGDRLAAVLAPVVLGSEPTIVLTVRSAAPVTSRRGDLLPQWSARARRSRSPRPRFARRARRSGSIRRCSVCSAPCVRHTFVSGILVVPFVGTLDRDVRRERRRDRRGARSRSSSSPPPNARSPTIGPAVGSGAGSPTSSMGTRSGGATDRCSTRCSRCSGRRRVADAVNAVTPEDRELRTLLGEARTIAVVGLSSKPAGRPSPSRPICRSAATASCR